MVRGRPGPAPQTDGEAGVVRAVDGAGGVERGGVRLDRSVTGRVYRPMSATVKTKSATASATWA